MRERGERQGEKEREEERERGASMVMHTYQALTSIERTSSTSWSAVFTYSPDC